MHYQPIKEEGKKIWIEWLEQLAKSLDGQPEQKSANSVFGTPDGDIFTAKYISGTFLATLKNEVVTIK